MVGTEAKAAAAKEENARNFAYPNEGFVCPVEHTLLYAMLTEPAIYPESVIKKEIDSMDNFEEYLPVNTKTALKNNEEGPVSFAQLSAVLALSAEKFPSASMEKNGILIDNKKDGNEEEKKKEAIPYRLSKKIMRAVAQYADKHNLDREAEIQELMAPVTRYLQKRIAKNEISESVPFYIGYTATLVTANPLFLLMGAAVSINTSRKNTSAREECANAETLATEANRRGDVEKTSLLDEAEDYDY